ncbi:hypothetical protein [Kitasatospora purpeofusca]|uniref:hypothetical protein n=1 Tax=Kitasatospora purpeofusca TaxID=67352 RepID=UPI003F4AE66E
MTLSDSRTIVGNRLLRGQAASQAAADLTARQGHRAGPVAPVRGSVALVYNPVGVDDALLERLHAVVIAHGRRPPPLLPGPRRTPAGRRPSVPSPVGPAWWRPAAVTAR